MTRFDDAKNLRDFALGDSMSLRHFDARLKPDLELAARRLTLILGKPVAREREKQREEYSSHWMSAPTVTVRRLCHESPRECFVSQVRFRRNRRHHVRKSLAP
jgi:hypothetical protein